MGSDEQTSSRCNRINFTSLGVEFELMGSCVCVQPGVALTSLFNLWA